MQKEHIKAEYLGITGRPAKVVNFCFHVRMGHRPHFPAGKMRAIGWTFKNTVFMYCAVQAADFELGKSACLA
jgi:hypothetical protein